MKDRILERITEEGGFVHGTACMPRQGYHVVDYTQPSEFDIEQDYLSHEVDLGSKRIVRFYKKLEKHVKLVNGNGSGK